MKKGARVVVWLAGVLCLGMSSLAPAQDESTGSPFYRGPYLGLMGSAVLPTGKNALDDGYGGTIYGGYRLSRRAAAEGSVSYVPMGGTGDPEYRGAMINGLLFPFDGFAGFYALLGVGALELKHYNGRTGSFSQAAAQGGLGLIFPMSIGDYEFGLRAEGLYRYGHREKRLNATQDDLDAPRNYEDVLVNVGLHFPLGMKKPPPVEAPVAVVAPMHACSDTQDNDADAKTDHPADPGCTAADDDDETDPPPPPPVCRTPAPGEAVTLEGCGAGDVIVLRGVNFDFDQSSLTVNAKTILDNVAAELTKYPDIKVEVGGHTDAKGSDDYNQKLSDRRAAAVVQYLESKGVGADRMTSVGYGETHPVADNETDDGRELNRRVELKVTAGTATAAGPPTTS